MSVIAAKDFYKILRIERNASLDEIKKAYHKRAMETHPDKEGGDSELFLGVNEAFRVLSDPDKRKAFDSGLPIEDDELKQDETDETDEANAVIREADAKWKAERAAEMAKKDAEAAFVAAEKRRKGNSVQSDTLSAEEKETIRKNNEGKKDPYSSFFGHR